MQPFSKVARFFIVALCCVLLLFLTVEIAHGHADGAPDAAHCPLCAAAHVAIGVSPAWLTAAIFLLLGILCMGDSSPGSRAVLVTAFIRPPPVSF